MKKFIQTLLLGVILFCAPFGLSAQQLSNNDNYVSRPPNFRWLDPNFYVTYTAGPANIKGQELIFDAKTGKQITSIKAKATLKPVIIPNRKSGRLDTLIDAKNTTLSPDSAHVAYTFQNNLYVMNLSTGNKWQITNDGDLSIYNGWSSWVYNEEILGRGMAYRAFWWSPDGKKIAFMRFDDTQVPIHYMVDDTDVHQKQIPMRYPLPGDHNPEVKIGIAQLDNKQLVWANFDAKKDQYFGEPV